MSINSVASGVSAPSPQKLAPQAKPVANDRDGDADNDNTESAAAKAKESAASSALPTNPSKGRNLNITA